METNYAIRWIVIYPVDSAIQRLNNWGLIGFAIMVYEPLYHTRLLKIKNKPKVGCFYK